MRISDWSSDVCSSDLGLFLPNCPYAVIFYFAALKAGATIVNFNPLYAEPEIARQIADSDTDVLVTLDLAALCNKVSAQIGKHRLKTVIVCPMAARSDERRVGNGCVSSFRSRWSADVSKKKQKHY